MKCSYNPCTTHGGCHDGMVPCRHYEIGYLKSPICQVCSEYNCQYEHIEGVLFYEI
jgi:hypothetical protein